MGENLSRERSTIWPSGTRECASTTISADGILCPTSAASSTLNTAHFDYYVTVPSSFIVAGSGELVNPKEVLTAQEVTRLEQARNSDATVMIRTPAEVNDPA